MKKRALLLAVLLSASMAMTCFFPVFAEELTSDSDTEVFTEILSDELSDGDVTSEGESVTVEPAEAAWESEEDDTGDATYYDSIYLHDDKTTGAVTGVEVVTYRSGPEEDTLEWISYWDAADGTWSYIDSNDEEYYYPNPGLYNLLGTCYWNIQIPDETTGVSKAVGGYVLNIKDGAGTWNYALTEEDVQAGLYQTELTDPREEVPAAFYLGVLVEDRANHAGLQTIEGEQYYLEENGSVVINDQRVIDGVTYHFGEDGKCDKTYIAQEAGWFVGKDGEYYWRQEDGTTLREEGFHVLNGQTYYLNRTSGRRRTGWITYKGNKYYLNPAEGDQQGVLMTGMQKIDGQYYYLMPTSGKMVTGWLTTADGAKYYFQSNGIRKRGWLTLDNKKYYFETDGKETFGWRSIDRKKYYFDPKTGVMKKGMLTLGKNKYYFNKDGTQHFGWQSIDGKKYYFVSGSGMMKKGMLTLGTEKYYFNADGTMYTGIRSISGKKYYFQSNGKLLTNRTSYQIGKKYYSIDSAGVLTEITEVEALAAQTLDEVGWNLYAAFKYSAGLTYEKTSIDVPDDKSEIDVYAEAGFKNGKGDSYVMAATFYQMAKLLGYDVYYVRGSVPLQSGRSVNQGWCEIDIDGETYVYDPYFYHEENRGGYKFHYGDSRTWKYENYSREN